ncbi:T9SS type A sorting domain-containing protein, partial [Paucihalobacter ruber]
TAAADVVTTTSADGTGNCTVAVAITNASFGDNCTGSSIAWTMSGAVTDSGSGQVGTYTFPIGTTTITYTVTDGANLTATDSMTVTVTDNENPTVTAAADVVTTTSADGTGNCTVAVAITNATFGDNCTGSSIAWTMSGAVTDSGSGQVGTYTFPIGTTTITYTVTDGANLTATDSMTVTVTDNENPTVTAAADVVTTTSADGTGNCTVAVAITNATFGDNCTGSSIAWTMSGAVTDSGSGQVGTYTFPIGTTTITYTVTDAANLTATDSMTVTVTDNENPTFVLPLPQANITVECDAIPAPVTLTASDNCGTAIVSFNETRTNGASPFEYTLTRTWTATDTSGNTRTQIQNISVRDTTPPVTPTLTDIVEDCSLIVTPPTTTDSCEGIITGTTSSDLTLDSPGIYEIFWIFTDSAGNSTAPVRQLITIIDEAPVPPTSIALLTLDGCQISGYDDLTIPTAFDFCDNVWIPGTLEDDFEFPFIFTGTQTIIWEFTDSNGNTSFQSQEIILNPLPVDGGALTATYDGNVFNSQVDIGACNLEVVVAMSLTNQSGTIARWERFAVNENVWVEIPGTAGLTSYTATFAPGALVSTYYRAIVQNGSCATSSSQIFVRALPSGEPPTVELLDEDNLYCLGEEVRILATSQIVTIDENTTIAYENGDFNVGQLNTNDPRSWLVDGKVGGWTAGGSSKKPKNWSGTTNNNQENGNIIYRGDGKFGIAYGNYNDKDYKGPDPTTLESPITDLSNAVTASVDFDQAYNLAVGDLAIIEISFDGGATYETLYILHQPGQPAINWWEDGDPDDYLNSTPTFYNFTEDNTSISLQSYLDDDSLDLTQVRIRWTFSGTTDNSAWALDNMTVNSTIFQETEIELTDGIGDPIEDPIYAGETNQAFTITPTTPGIHEYGVTTLINGCRTYDGEGTNLVTVRISYSNAGENIELIGGDCGQNVVQLNAYDNRLTATQNALKGSYTLPVDCIDCDNPGTIPPGDIAGEWTWEFVSGNTCGDGAFSDPNDPNAQFTAEEGTYTLTWTVDGCSDSIEVVIENCNQVDFDGADDYVEFGTNDYQLNNNFSVETWVKLESLAGSQTVLSKRDGNAPNNGIGYDLTVENSGEVVFKYRNASANGRISSLPYKIDNNRWYHLGITYNNSNNQYVLYVDGVLINSAGGTAPGNNNNRALLGAMDNSSTHTESENHFNGWIDEVRIWNTTLTTEQLRLMMNQQITESPTTPGNVQGATVPLDIPNLSWNNLIGYYKMDVANVSCGYLNSTLGNNIRGKLKNITSQLVRSAPIPYTSGSDGVWTNVNTWSNPIYWDIPNGNGINGAAIDWNIVRTAHNISSGDKDITVLGLLVDNNELSIQNSTAPFDETNNGQMLWVTHYLKLDGKIDLVGESQLIQKRYTPTQFHESIFDDNSIGILERDQQGTTNPFNYNYWGSPVQTGLNSFSIGGVLRDGTTTVDEPINRLINWVNSNTAAGGDPTQVSTRWLYAYFDAVGNTYSEWDRLNLGSELSIGLGFTMKGSGNGYDVATFDGTAVQNYVFIGKPNNGRITNNLGASVGGVPNQILLGNPYPSAIDADEFIRDNEGVLADGALLFWEHFAGNSTHILRDYQGGYAVYNLSGGLESTRPPITSDGVEIIGGNGTTKPERYVPVGQGFFVNSSSTGGLVTFKNSQRIGKREGSVAGGNGSIFFRPAGNVENNAEDAVKRVRLRFKSPEGAIKPLLLGFVPNNLANDDVNYGYDAKNRDNYPSDISWLINDEKYAIQGVGDFNEASMYPVGIDLAISGKIEINLNELENFDNEISVYVFDALLDTYTLINEANFTTYLEAGDYFDRFFITFTSERTLTNEEVNSTQNLLYYLFDSKQIYINWSNSYNVNKVELINTLGQTVRTWTQFEVLNNREILIPVDDLSEGVYVVKAQDRDGEIMSKKVIIKQ